MSLLLSLISVQAMRSITSVRWLLVPLGGLAASYFQVPEINIDYSAGIIRQLNMWDAFPSLLTNKFYLGWYFFFGFLFLVGDDFWREHEEGTITLIALRAPSRRALALSRLLTFGVLAIFFVLLALLGSLVGALMAGAPFSLHSSLASQSAVSADSLANWFPGLPGVPMPIFSFFLCIYSAVGLWSAACLIFSISLAIGSPNNSLWISFGWLMLSYTASLDYFHANKYIVLLDVRYFLTYAKHFFIIFPSPMSLLSFCLLNMITLAVAFGYCSWRLRTIDL